MKTMKSTGRQPKHDEARHPALYLTKLELMVVSSLASGYSKSTGLKRQSAYPGEPGKIVFGKCDRPPWRNRQDKIKIAKKEIGVQNFVILRHRVEAQMK